MNEDRNIKIDLSPDALKVFQKTLKKSSDFNQHQASFLFRQAAEEAAVGKLCLEDEGIKYAVLCSLISDLLEQGWIIKRFDPLTKSLFILAPVLKQSNGESIDDVKSRIREGLTAISNRQLASDSVQEFIDKMERIRTFKKKEVSITSLVDSGSELAKAIEKIKKKSLKNADKYLNEIIDPFVQVCEENSKCSQTGLYLQDIWRYFRHTWSLEYKPIPGRTMRLLIRNKARENWPIMGIAMLASPAMNLYVRDEWIGWRMDDIFSGLINNSIDPKAVAICLYQTIKDALDKIRKDDILGRRSIEKPDEYLLLKIESIASVSKNNRRQDLENREERKGDAKKKEVSIDIRGQKGSSINWRKLSSTSLFKKKRAETLVPLLKAYWHFKGANIEKEPVAGLYALLSTKLGKEAVAIALDELRKARLASQVADVSVCGAIAPYNHLIGGKLVTLLMGSEEVRNFYKKRYNGQISEIASQLAGKPVSRSADLLLLTTTSLYGIGSSQYSRIKIPANYVEGIEYDSEWEELRLTQGFGVTHLSDETVLLMRKLGRQFHGVRKVNSVFGEGSSPRVRLIREALLILGINDEVIMKHGLSRIVYAHEYFPGARGLLTGFSSTKKRFKAPSTKSLSRAWIKRWVVNRIQRVETIEVLRKLDKNIVSIEMKNRVVTYNSLHRENSIQKKSKRNGSTQLASIETRITKKISGRGTARKAS